MHTVECWGCWFVQLSSFIDLDLFFVGGEVVKQGKTLETQFTLNRK